MCIDSKNEVRIDDFEPPNRVRMAQNIFDSQITCVDLYCGVNFASERNIDNH